MSTSLLIPVFLSLGLIEVDKLKHDSGVCSPKTVASVSTAIAAALLVSEKGISPGPDPDSVGKHFIHRFPHPIIRRRNFLAALMFRSLTSSQQQEPHYQNTC